MSQEMIKLGQAAERRVIAKLRGSVTTIEGRSKTYPDFMFELDYSKLELKELAPLFGREVYGVEVKTMKGFYQGEKVGIFGVSKEEFNAYEKLSSEMKIIIIVEIRPRGYHWSKYLHYIVEWSAIRDRYFETKPNNLRLSMWWVLSNGTKLEDWIKLGYR